MYNETKKRRRTFLEEYIRLFFGNVTCKGSLLLIGKQDEII